MAVKTNYEKNGSKYYRVTATVGKTPEGKPIRKEFYGKSKSEAEALRDDYLKGLDAGLNTNYKEMAISDLMYLWLYEVIRVSRAYSTFDRYEGIYRNYVKNSPLANLKVYDIKPLTLQRHYNAMVEDGKTGANIFNLNKLLKTFFYYAMAEGYIITNPCFRVAIPKQAESTEEDDEVDPFSDEEIKQIAEKLKPELEMICLLCLGTGLRKGELLALMEKDLSLDGQELRVNKTLKSVKIIEKDGSYRYETVVKPPKTKNSIRTVPIPCNLIAPLKRHILKQKEKYLKNGVPFDENSLIFTTESCRYIDGNNLLRAWKRTLKRANVRYRNFHNIRHTYATKLFEQNVNIKTVQMLLGHSSMKITADIYTHVMPKEKENAVQVLNYLFKN